MIRPAKLNDVSRIAEILIFTKRMNYRCIFQDDKVSFGEMQVYALAQNYIDNPSLLNKLLNYAIKQFGCNHLWVLEKITMQSDFMKDMVFLSQKKKI